jgi:hypothetical protein
VREREEQVFFTSVSVCRKPLLVCSFSVRSARLPSCCSTETNTEPNTSIMLIITTHLCSLVHSQPSLIQRFCKSHQTAASLIKLVFLAKPKLGLRWQTFQAINSRNCINFLPDPSLVQIAQNTHSSNSSFTHQTCVFAKGLIKIKMCNHFRQSLQETTSKICKNPSLVQTVKKTHLLNNSSLFKLVSLPKA